MSFQPRHTPRYTVVGLKPRPQPRRESGRDHTFFKTVTVGATPNYTLDIDPVGPAPSPTEALEGKKLQKTTIQDKQK